MELKPVVKGIATLMPGFHRVLARGNVGGTASADYCYTVWMKHVTYLWESGMHSMPSAIAELGPGETLGVGIAWLLAGASRFYALDVVAHSNTTDNLRLLDQLVERFQRRSTDTIAGWPDFQRLLGPNSFPTHILSNEHLERTLAPPRIDAIREAIRNPLAAGEPTVQYVAPWTDADILPPRSVDLIYSHSVLEHVRDACAVYASCARWLKPNGWMSHQVDLQSHGVTRAWNGHWQYPQWLWKLIVGGRPYLINRHPAAKHLHMMQAVGFEPMLELRNNRADGMAREHLSRPYRDMPDSELTCCGLFIQARKAPNIS